MDLKVHVAHTGTSIMLEFKQKFFVLDQKRLLQNCNLPFKGYDSKNIWENITLQELAA